MTNLDEYETAKLQATIDRQKKKLAKQRQRIVKYQNDEDRKTRFKPPL
jgi:hypothetical protein